MPKPVLGPRRRTHPLIWCAAVICTILAVAVIITGLVVFVGYLIIRPKVPYVSVSYAHLDYLSFDRVGHLTTQLTIHIRAKNDNVRAHASFYDANFEVSFLGIEIAKLVAYPFDVGKNSSVVLTYQATSTPIPLNPTEMDNVDMSYKQDKIAFDLRGSMRTRWRVGVLGSVKFTCPLNCQLNFRPSNKSYIEYSQCTSRSK